MRISSRFAAHVHDDFVRLHRTLWVGPAMAAGYLIGFEQLRNRSIRLQGRRHYRVKPRGASMKRIFATVVFAWCVGFASATIADPPGSDAAALKLQLMKTTQIVDVMDFPGAPDKFVPDNDPDSLQIVFLAKTE